MTTNLSLERESCTRCGGSGHHSYCQTHGTVCFKCGGKKETLSVRGQAAANHLRTLRSRRTADLKVGDVIRVNAMTVGCNLYQTYATVQAITPSVQRGSSLVGGVMVAREWHGFEVETDKVTLSLCLPDQMHELRLSKEEQMETLRQAIAYQATLTKAGTPRKTAAR